MATYVVGDVQGCFDSLVALAEAINFGKSDQMWFVGDLVNRGPKNVEVLRWIRDLGDRGRACLGNHDLHLLARAAGVAERKRLETLQDVLDAPDRDELVEWLRHREIVIEHGDDLIVHAGFLPSWTVGEIKKRASKLSKALRRDDWPEAIAKVKTRRGSIGATAAVMQRIRTIYEDEVPASFAGPPDRAPDGARPWFDYPHERGSFRVVFGHWSALGLMVRDDAVCLDTGCVWGRSLTALCLETGKTTSVGSQD